MLIKGLQKTTLLDFPEKVACTVFTGGCNFRCPFCHNASLVKIVDDERIDIDEFFSFLNVNARVPASIKVVLSVLLIYVKYA